MATRTTHSTKPVSINRFRINILLLVVLVFCARIIVQLGNIQIVRQESLSSMARAEFDRRLTLQPSRGVIRDSKGNVLALDVERESLYINPILFNPDNAPRVALVLSTLLNKPAADLQALLSQRTHYARIERWLEPEIAERIRELKEPGLEFVSEPRRIYPQGEYAAHTIGAVNYEGVGVSGVEAFYDTQLKGITGTITAEWDASNNPIWITPPQTQPASNGIDLELTIDPLIQHVIETELKAAVDAHDADGGTIIVMDVHTGAIRGIANYPTFDPNRYIDYDPETYNLNPAIGKVYEPGSTFKILTVAMGLETGAFTADTLVNDSGVIDRYGYPLSNFDSYGRGMITPGQVLYYSSNVGALLLAELTGVDDFYKFVDAFGYGKLTGIDIGGEAPGMYRLPTSPDWGPLDLDTNAYGQSIAVTPLQQVRMAAAIANGGKIMKPYIVQRQCHGDNCVETQPEVVAQPISPEVAAQVRQMLQASANGYVNASKPDTLWLVPGYAVGAKTGTSSVPNGYGGFENWTIGSVLGMAPIDNPRYAVLVKIDHAKDDIWGVRTALLPYRNVVAQLMRYERLAPNPEMVGPYQTAGVIEE